MEKFESPIRRRYPVHALLLIGVCWCFYAVVVLILSLFMLPIVPLAPVFVVIVSGLGGLLSSVHEYGRSLSTPVQASRVRNLFDGKTFEIPRAQSQTSPQGTAHTS